MFLWKSSDTELKTAIEKFEVLHTNMYELWNWITSTYPMDLDIKKFRSSDDGIEIHIYAYRNNISEYLDVLTSLNTKYDDTYVIMNNLFKAKNNEQIKKTKKYEIFKKIYNELLQENNEQIKKTKKYETFKKIYNELLQEINNIRWGQHGNENKMKSFTTPKYDELLIEFNNLNFS
jgi:hypothetical protein